MEDKELLDGIMKEVSSFFGVGAKKASEELKHWSETLLKLKIAKFKANEDEIKNLEKSEKYSWLAIQALKTEYSEQITKDSWAFAEKMLLMLKKVIAS